MIRTLAVERFKSLVKLRLELGRVNVFVGANGSGKSNLLEALGVASAAAFGRVDDETLLRRGVRPGVPALYRSAFPSGKSVNDIRLEVESAAGASFSVTLWNPKEDAGAAWSFKTEKLAGRSGVVVSRSPASKKWPNPEQGVAAWTTVQLKQGDPALELMDTLRGYAIHAPSTQALRGLTQDAQSREPVGLAGGRLPEALDELLQAARGNATLSAALDEARDLIDWARDFASAPSAKVPLSPSAARSRLVVKFEDRYMTKGRNSLTGYDASEGALYVLFCAVLALHPKAARCVAVDNVDQALNPRLARRLISHLCSWFRALNGQRQCLLTVHNPAVLDGLPLGDPDVRLFVVDRNSSGHSVVRRIDLDAAAKARPSPDWTLSRMWMEGLLGGVPNV